MLTVENLTAGYGHVQALKGVSIQIDEKEVATLIGSNGAGKSTIIKTIAGLLHPQSGEIFFEKNPIHRLPAYA